MIMLSRRVVLSGAAIPLLWCGAAGEAGADDPTDPLLDSWARKLVEAAASQVGVTTIYDPAYVSLSFPGGDVPPERGVCTDVVVRAYRKAFGFDLQQAVNADMKNAFAAYPKRWGMKRPDRNIDHRRVGNLQTFWRRKGAEKPIPKDPSEWQAGDIVTQMLPGALPHLGIVSMDREETSGQRLIIHNIGSGTQIEAVLDRFEITGRYRFGPELF